MAFPGQRERYSEFHTIKIHTTYRMHQYTAYFTVFALSSYVMFVRLESNKDDVLFFLFTMLGFVTQLFVSILVLRKRELAAFLTCSFAFTMCASVFVCVCLCLIDVLMVPWVGIVAFSGNTHLCLLCFTPFLQPCLPCSQWLFQQCTYTTRQHNSTC